MRIPTEHIESKDRLESILQIKSTFFIGTRIILEAIAETNSFLIAKWSTLMKRVKYQKNID